ncbi:5'-3' exonuclease [Caulobacter phage Percy]|uniref:5'-3' exonuclease n=1 Tax=Caulobacter phage Percy TaxID=1701809 RepID=A0A0M4R1V3_9CAUD|nr:exonuclease [Caulobacter phage Percy]ALF01658.1 5'-3' exonuclease [Caulobacter phage Percy]
MAFDALEALEGLNISDMPVYPETVPGLVLHVDGDYLAYYGSGKDTKPQDEAWADTLKLVEIFRLRTGSEKVVMHNTGDTSDKGGRFHVGTVKPYQGQRDPGRKPANYRYIRTKLLTDGAGPWQTKTWQTREADDGIGACALYATTQPVGYCAIATADKDMRMLPGLHIDWVKPDIPLTRVLPGQFDVLGANFKQYGLKWFWLQMLMGDTADNCPGLPQYRYIDPKKGDVKFAKVGEKTAEKLLEDCKTSQEAYLMVSTLYQEAYTPVNDEGDFVKGHTEWADRFVEQAALLWMRTDATATLLDFLNHAGASKLCDAWHPDIRVAAARLLKRVTTAREKVEALGSR